MAATHWDFLILLSRVALYLATAGCIGGLFVLLVFSPTGLRTALWRYLRGSCVLGLLAALCYFFLRTAALGGEWSAAVDSLMLSITARSAIGHSAAAWCAGFALVLLSSFTLRLGHWMRRASALVLLLGIVAVLAAYPLAGHLAGQDLATRIALSLHVLAMSLWVGSMYPLLRLLRGDRAHKDMKLFGEIGVGLVGLLLTCGLWLALVLLGDFAALLDSAYGRVLLLKLGLLTPLLLLAAANKWWLVPRLPHRELRGKLRRSIGGELALALAILVATGVLANLLSPAS